jgi:hypothetical protein
MLDMICMVFMVTMTSSILNCLARIPESSDITVSSRRSYAEHTPLGV